MVDDLEKYNSYLGDGVYVTFDGYQIWLAVDDSDNIVVRLHPQVIQNFIEYLKKHKMI